MKKTQQRQKTSKNLFPVKTTVLRRGKLVEKTGVRRFPKNEKSK